MKIAIFSDTHCGFKYGEERGEDAFIAMEEAMNKSLDCDLILIAGDMFDGKVPKPEVYARTAKILSKAQNAHSNAKLVSADKEVSLTALRGIPIVTIHGTHERRAKTMINPLHSLESSGLLIHLDMNTAVFDINGQKVAIHGFSGVSEKYAKETLDKWDPKPVPGANNIFMFHQSVDPYIYSPLDPPTIKLNELPKGFNLYILGHIHWSDIQDLNGGKFLLTGSTTPTSIHKKEVEQPKYIFKYDGSNIDKIKLEKQRKVIIEEFEFEAGIKEKIYNLLSAIPAEDPKQIVVIKIKGTLPKDCTPPNFREIEERFKDKFILIINKNIEEQGLENQLELFKNLKDNRLSPEEQGLRILEKQLSEMKCGINPNEIFDLLVEGNSDMIFNLLTGKQRTLA
ncbi:MAG: DNA repair exonuclease [Candidatus Aenigmarchaeota archaeon]|nr:DNA repair exonuclease [Candidatus Aenigmarchaeota archaeon]